MQFALLGFVCDEGVRRNHGRPGACEGPQAFRKSFQKVNFLKPIPIQDFGDIFCENNNLEDAQKRLGFQVEKLLSSGFQPIVIGGGHETAYGHFLGISQFLRNQNCGVINFDAHFDLRPLIQDHLGSSGTPFLQIAQERQEKKLNFDYLVLGLQRFSNSKHLFQTAKDLGVHYVLAENLSQEAPKQIQAILDRHQFIYLSICLDVFAEAYAPGVSAPQSFGISPQQFLPLLKMIRSSGKVIALDIAELAPTYDRYNITAQLASHILGHYFDSILDKSTI